MHEVGALDSLVEQLTYLAIWGGASIVRCDLLLYFKFTLFFVLLLEYLNASFNILERKAKPQF